MHRELALCIERVATQEEVPSRPHRPVLLHFHPRAIELHMWEFKDPEKIPLTRVIGPIAELRDHSEVILQARQAVQMASAGATEQALADIDKAYAL